MYAVIGVLLLALGVVSFQFAYIQHNRPIPARWTKPELASQLVCVVLLSAMAAGVSCAAHFLIFSGFAALTAVDVGLAIAVVLFMVLLLVAQGRQWQRLQAAVAPGGPVLHSSNDDSDPGRPPRSGVTGGRPRRAA